MAEIRDLPEELRSLVWTLTGHLKAASANVADLSLGQQAVLARLLTAPGRTGAELARAEHVSPQAMSVIVAELMGRGLLTARPDTEDGRRRRLTLTAEGERTIQTLREKKTDWLRETLAARLTPQEQRTVAQAVTLLARLLD